MVIASPGIATLLMTDGAFERDDGPKAGPAAIECLRDRPYLHAHFSRSRSLNGERASLVVPTRHGLCIGVMIETLCAAIVAIVFLVPGYIWRTVESQFAYLDRRLEWEKFALGLLARSTAVYAIFSAQIYRAWKNNSIDTRPLYTTLAFIFLIGVCPSLLGCISGVLRQKKVFAWLIKKLGLQTFEAHQIPTAWDYIFSKMTSRFAIITLKNGAKLYGYLGEDSYFSSDPEARDLFVSAVLQPADKDIIEPVPGTAGVYINKDEVSLIEFIKEPDNG